MSQTIIADQNLSQLEHTIADMVKTLRRNASKTLEMKRRTAQAFAYHNCCTGSLGRGYRSDIRRNPGGSTTSLNYPNPSFQWTQRFAKSQQMQSTSTQRDTGTQSFQSNQSLNSVKTDPGGRATVSSKKLKSIVFRTLDRIFQVRNGSSQPQIPMAKPSQNIANDGHELQGFTGTTVVDELPVSLSLSAFQGSCSTLAEDETIRFPDMENCSGVMSTDSSDDEGERSWEYIDHPIREEVIMYDSLKYADAKRRSTLNKSRNKAPTAEADLEPQQRRSRRYVKRVSKKGGESKIERLNNERKREQDYLSTQQVPDQVMNLGQAVYKQNLMKTKVIRPDSPIHSSDRGKPVLCPSSSLPNLMEASFVDSADSDSLPDFNTSSFSREISLRPSSTLIKPSPKMVPHSSRLVLSSTDTDEDNDDDASSSCTTSSFSSMQILDEEPIVTAASSSQSLQNDKGPVQSALRKDVYVMPINVPVVPLSDMRDIKGMSTSEFKKIILDREKAKAQASSIPEEGQGVERSTSEVEFSKASDIQCKPSAKVRKRKEPIIPTSTDELKVIQEAFSWLDDENPEGFEEDDDEKENDPVHELSPPQPDNRKYDSISVRNTTALNLSSYSTLNSSVPPPPPLPPLPPPMPSEMTTISTMSSDGTISRIRLPLEVINQPRTGESIFDRIEYIDLGEMDARKLREKFPLLSKKNGELKLKQSPSSETLKFQLNIELFLKKWDIVGTKVDILLESISTLNAKPNLIDMTCITTLPIPKKEEIEKIRQAQSHRKLGHAEDFLLKLSRIPNLDEKLNSIRFSLDFEESTQAVFRQISLFTSTCNALSTSRKFIKIIEVVMALMNSLNTDGGSKIYGFDIQSLSKLAMKTSEDGTTTLLHFLIEYILNSPSLKEDRKSTRLDFNDLSTASKTSLMEINEHCKAWKKSLELYGQELAKMGGDDPVTDSRFEFPIKFQKTALSTLTDLTRKINAAQQVFKSCKECYGLSNREITENGFFDSLSQFISAYRKVYNEVVERSQRVKVRRRNCIAPVSSESSPVVKKGIHPHRKSGDFKGLSVLKPNNNIQGNGSEGGSDELTQCLLDMCSSDKNPNRVPPNRRRRSMYL